MTIRELITRLEELAEKSGEDFGMDSVVYAWGMDEQTGFCAGPSPVTTACITDISEGDEDYNAVIFLSGENE